jgi:hypothetical protein
MNDKLDRQCEKNKLNSELGIIVLRIKICTLARSHGELSADLYQKHSQRIVISIGKQQAHESFRSAF